MTLYCLVQNGFITQGPSDLPTNWLNMTGFDKHPSPEDFDWYTFTDSVPPDYDDLTQTRETQMVIDDTAKTVNRVYTSVNKSLTEAFEAVAEANKAACREHIIASYDEDAQRNADGGRTTPEYKDAMDNFIVACVAEENRVFTPPL